MFDFTSKETTVLLNPRMKKQQAADAEKFLPKDGAYSSHFWVATSGTTRQASNEKKWVALSKKAVLHSAASVNTFFSISSSDTWIHPLPSFHVGGLGIWARAYLSNSKVISLPDWSAKEFTEIIEKEEGTLSALVPTQVYDLVMTSQKAPSSLRAVIVGGAPLSTAVYNKAIKLGWPLSISYGMSECASQVATALPKTRSAKILSHVDVKTDEDGILEIKSEALLTTYAYVTPTGITIRDPKVNGWFSTGDRGSVNHNILEVAGRGSRFIKVGGESVNLQQLELLLEELSLESGLHIPMKIIPVQDERLGHVLNLHAISAIPQDFLEQFNKKVMPFERIRQVVLVDSLPQKLLT